MNACIAALHKVSSCPRKASPLCIILASATYPASGLENLGRAVSTQFTPRCLIGAVVDGVATDKGYGPGLSITLMDDASGFECAGFTVNQDDVRHVKQKAVGRWPDLGRGFGKDTDAEAFDMKNFTTVSMGGGSVALPSGLQKVSHRSSETALVLSFSDTEPHQFLETLDASFPTATKVGLVGTMTPFVTGRPHTIYYNDKVLSGGLVGVALLSKSARVRAPIAKVTFTALEALGEPLTITSCRGNIILNIDDTNAAKELLVQMTNRPMTAGISAEQQLYVKVVEDSASNSRREVIYRLTGGDPSKGTLAVDTIKDLQVGMRIQFMQHMGTGNGMQLVHHEKLEDNTLVFLCTDADAAPSTTSSDKEPRAPPPALLSRGLFAGSEKGFFFGHATSSAEDGNAINGTLSCDVPLSTVAVRIE
ncbi:hypothetical protein HKX48_002392 [Thoreauomyces humboldtii]|nr:hypothetical protein HKX48_002392 [Thoreauomyces humboldtii]